MIARPFIAGTKVIAGLATAVALGGAAVSIHVRAEEIPISIGTQNTTYNTTATPVVLKELKLLEKHLPDRQVQGPDLQDRAAELPPRVRR
jgi:NitT/TauT family transport system substrate-binding protein